MQSRLKIRANTEIGTDKTQSVTTTIEHSSIQESGQLLILGILMNVSLQPTKGSVKNTFLGQTIFRIFGFPSSSGETPKI